MCCQCPMYSPLTVQIESPYDLVQLLGVLRSLHCSRGELIQLLKDCWRLEVSGVDH
ncbi:Asr1405/Asl0597 family protein [Microcystis panniformis]|uniref:Asr1405/Asl0597 family protein n=1 Tax=Microcystis panniformis TaxID=513223 RepID=UPI00350E8F5A